MRLDSVEIKVTIPGEQVAEAARAFRLPLDRRQWKIYFCEDVARGSSPGTPLLDAGVVLRARDKGGARDDATVKLRPCRRSQLTPHWLAAREGGNEGEGWELKLEADWAGSRKALAASITADRPDDRIGKVRNRDCPLSRLFTEDQQRFLLDCAGIQVNLDMLTLLPPIAATRWTPFGAPETDPELEIRAERWRVDDVLDFLELSIVADVDHAGSGQAALEHFVGSHGFDCDAAPETKTRRVLEHLVLASTR